MRVLLVRLSAFDVPNVMHIGVDKTELQLTAKCDVFLDTVYN